jgi:hypothetical protein
MKLTITPLPPADEGPGLQTDGAASIAVMALRAVALLAFALVLILVALPVALVAAGT